MKVLTLHYFFMHAHVHLLSCLFNMQSYIRNSLPSEHVLDFHPASQCPRGHCPFTLLHPTPFKQWHLLLQPSPKLPLSHSVIRKHSNNKNNVFGKENKNCSHSIQNNTISVDFENIKINIWWPLVLSNIVRFEVVSSWNWWNRSSSLFKPPFHN